MKAGASGYSVLAAPEDGRTPPISLPPSLTHYRSSSLRAIYMTPPKIGAPVCNRLTVNDFQRVKPVTNRRSDLCMESCK